MASLSQYTASSSEATARQTNNIETATTRSNDHHRQLDTTEGEIDNTVLESTTSSDEEEGRMSNKVKGLLGKAWTEVRQMKWRFLLVSCLTTTGYYWSSDIPTTLGTGDGDTIQTRFQERGETFTQEMNLAQFSVDAYSALIFGTVGGLCVDKWLGARWSLIIFTLMPVLGGLINWIAVILASYPILIVGRFFFSLGLTIQTARSVMLGNWFRHGGFAVAFSISVGSARIGSLLDFALTPAIAEKYGVDTAMFVPVVLTFFSFLMSWAVFFFDKYGEAKGMTETNQNPTRKLTCQEARRLPLLFWGIGFCIACCYAGDFSFLSYSKNLLQVRYGLSATAAGPVVSIFAAVAGGFLPVTGLIVTYFGRYLWFVLGSSLQAVLTLICIIKLPTSFPPQILFASLGSAYCLMVSSLWTMIPLVVDPDQQGLAFGIGHSSWYSLQVFLPFVTGHILDVYQQPENSLPDVAGYEYVTVVSMSILAASIPALILMSIYDRSGFGHTAGTKRKHYGIMTMNAANMKKAFDEKTAEFKAKRAARMPGEGSSSSEEGEASERVSLLGNDVVATSANTQPIIPKVGPIAP